MDDAAYLDPFERLLETHAPLKRLRAAEAGAPVQDLWSALAASGFLDVLVPEAEGGFGMAPALAGRIIEAVGRHLVPAPVGETMVARALLAAFGGETVDGPIVLVTALPVRDGYQTAATPHAAAAQFALVDFGTEMRLVALNTMMLAPIEAHASQSCVLRWPGVPDAVATMPRPFYGLRPLAALVRAACIAGAAGRVAQITFDYAATRVQFGKPIGSYQAIQQQLAVMGEQAVMARTAAQIGFANGFPPAHRAIAIAKHVTGNAAHQIAAIAHAVHGAIGFSEAHDLQLYTRRLHEWRLADGADSYWAGQLGAEVLASDAGTIDFVRA